ncbi:hypothetical protein, partial [Actinacidiphila oryziradicis]|uniref:hypothetical protein n=1 Tax=Actinacidiphila oryziradicis TaxID=2571141 RepID=UPI0023F541A8
CRWSAGRGGEGRTRREAKPQPGFGDWNLSWAAWMKGSATGARAETVLTAKRIEAAPRLRPEL